MAKDWYEHFGNEQHRGDFVASEIARLITPDTSDPPEVAARKKREAAETLRRHDALFGVWPGCTLGVPWSAGDAPEARDD